MENFIPLNPIHVLQFTINQDVIDVSVQDKRFPFVFLLYVQCLGSLTYNGVFKTSKGCGRGYVL